MYECRVRLFVACAVMALVAGRSTGAEATWVFRFDPAGSGMDATLDMQLSTDGTLIGDHQADTNPEGTRTKPGLFTPFADDENVPVPASVSPRLSGDWLSTTEGSFHLTVDLDAETASVSALSAELLSGGPVALGGSVDIDFDTFRTRSPESIFIGFVPPIPIGEAVLSDLAVVQLPGPAVGTITPIADEDYLLSVAVPTQLGGMIDFFGIALELPPTPFVVLLEGELTLSDQSAALTSTQPLDEPIEQPIGLPLPTIPLDLPTILPEGATAHLLLDLTIVQLDMDFTGTLDTAAQGVPIGTGDCNGDNVVTLDDYTTLLDCLLGPTVDGEPPCACVDMDGDGDTDLIDFAHMQTAWGSL